MDRRQFLKGMGIGNVTISAPFPIAKLSKEIYLNSNILYGDGFHDDSAAFQAAINGQPVFKDGKRLDYINLKDNRVFYIPGGKYVVSTPLKWG